MTDELTRKEKFLVEMYKQCFNDIDRHIKVAWQASGVLVAAFAIFALTEKKVLPLDVAVSLMVVIVTWLIGNLIDASYWYNRNLAMIANIERHFLGKQDLRDVHYYFGKHREDNKPIWQLLIQFWFGVVLVAVVLGFHFVERVLPNIRADWGNVEPLRAMPYALAGLSMWFLAGLRLDRNKSLHAFLYNSPGLPVDTSQIDYKYGRMTRRDWLFPFKNDSLSSIAAKKRSGQDSSI